MRIHLAVAALVAACASSPCAAEVLANGSLGLGAPPFTGNGQFGLGAKATVGFAPDQIPVQFEYGYLTTGRLRDTNGGPESAFNGTVAALGYRGAMAADGRSLALTRIGWYEGYSEILGRDLYPYERTGARGLTLGLGFEYRFMPYIGLRIGLDALFNVPDFSGPMQELKGDGSSDFFLLTVGVTMATGSPQLVAERETRRAAALERREQRQRGLERKRAVADARDLADARERELAATSELEAFKARQAARAEAVLAEAARVEAARAEAAKPAAVAAAPVAPAPLAPGRPARLRAGALLRTRATPEGDAVRGFDPAQPVTLKVRISNGTGDWWYVNTAGPSGWVLEGELDALPQ